jgi:hypothetical protein
MREYYVIQLEKAKVQILLCREVLSYTDIPEELKDKISRLHRSCLESEEYFLAKLKELD